MFGADERFEGASLTDPGFAGDSGEVPADVATALARFAADPGTWPEVLTTLRASRLLIPVLSVPAAQLSPADHHNRDHDQDHDQDRDQDRGRSHSAEMAAILLEGADGRRALLAFTGLEPLAAWNREARPLPVATRVAAESAVREGAAALLIDVAGPVTVVVQGEDLTALAEGWLPARVGGQSAWIRPAPE